MALHNFRSTRQDMAMEMSVRLSEAAEGFHRRLDDHKVKLLIGIDRQISATMAEAAAI